MVDPEFVDYLRDLFAELGPISVRAMFGGHGVYHGGLIFGLVADGELYLKADATTRGDFEAAGCAPFVYLSKGKPMTLNYWSLPADALESPQAMLPWAQRAYAAAVRHAAKKRPGAAKTGSKRSRKA